MKIEALRQIQFWELTVRQDHTCTLICRENSGIEPVVRQEIEFTDFPLPIPDRPPPISTHRHARYTIPASPQKGTG